MIVLFGLVFLNGNVMAINLDSAQMRGSRHRAVGTIQNATGVAVDVAAQFKANERAQADNLLHFLADHHGPMPNRKQFLSECLEHIHDFMEALDHSYSDVQVRHLFKHACDEDPGHDDLNFDHKEGCEDFSARLVEARHYENEHMGEITEYQVLCKHYYETEVCDRHHCEKDDDKKESVVQEVEADVEKVEEEVEEAVALPSKCWLLLAAFMISCCLGGYGAHKRHITGIVGVVVFVASFIYICFFTNLMHRFVHGWGMSWTCWFLCVFVACQGITYLAYLITFGLTKAGIIKHESITSHF